MSVRNTTGWALCLFFLNQVKHFYFKYACLTGCNVASALHCTRGVFRVLYLPLSHGPLVMFRECNQCFYWLIMFTNHVCPHDVQLLMFVGKEDLIEEVKDFIVASVKQQASIQNLHVTPVVQCCSEFIKAAFT